MPATYDLPWIPQPAAIWSLTAFHACSTFTRATAREFAEVLERDVFSEGFGGFLASAAAPLAFRTGPTEFAHWAGGGPDRLERDDPVAADVDESVLERGRPR